MDHALQDHSVRLQYLPLQPGRKVARRSGRLQRLVTLLSARFRQTETSRRLANKLRLINTYVDAQRVPPGSVFQFVLREH